MRTFQKNAWERLEAEARQAFVGLGRFPLLAYSEQMPPPRVGLKPYRSTRARREQRAADFEISEYEQAHELRPGLERIATRVLGELAKLLRGEATDLSRTLLERNPAWPETLAEACRRRAAVAAPLHLLLELALSRTQDDKGNVRWTLFGVSHEEPGAPLWSSLGADAEAQLGRIAGFCLREPPLAPEALRVLASADELPPALRPRILSAQEPLDGVRVLVSFRPFAELPAAVQERHLAGRLAILPTPASLVFREHPGYRRLAEDLPRARQIPLLHLFPRGAGPGLRIPQSGWLDERAGDERTQDGHLRVESLARPHRFQRVARDEEAAEGAFLDRVSRVLFSVEPDDLGLYGKPLARNAQVWRADYRLLLDGPRATDAELARAAAEVRAGGRFGYRMLYPPMQIGRRELFWHLPLVARLDPAAGQVELLEEGAPLGYLLAEPQPGEGIGPIVLEPRLLARSGHREAVTQFLREPGRARHTTCHNLRRLLDWSDHLGGPLPGPLARALVRAPQEHSLDEWVARLPALALDAAAGERAVAELRARIAGAAPAGAPLTLAGTASRAFEEELWRTIAWLAEGELQAKDNADPVAVNAGRDGGQVASLVRSRPRRRHDLDRLGDELHARHDALIARHQLTGRAFVADQRFRWESGCELAWSERWRANRAGEAFERNVVVVIPGRDRGEAVVMADHYDTAYMEDAYDPARGGDRLRVAAAGADDNHSATATLLAAADALLPLAREGKLARDVWLVHLTGEEFPADCLGARAFSQALVERRLRLSGRDGAILDLSRVDVVGAFVLDMIGHNSERGRDLFQISAGEGAAAARLAARTLAACQRWNAHTRTCNRSSERAGRGRARRMPDGSSPPPPFAHLPLAGEIRAEWEPRSSLYNTDGQIFSDVGVPVVLLMENYDLDRAGYHDTSDTLAMIDLDYAAALAAIAIEAVADCACARTL
jgi:hypothetical protein